jgi:hypothetical protein
LSRFVKTISEPLDKWEALYSIWQEAKRKDVERGFGVVKKKFAFLQNPFQKYFIEDIVEIDYCCFVLHNMAVEDCIIAADNIPESAAFYDIVNEEEAIALAEQPAGEIAAMASVKGQDDALAYSQLEIQCLAGMGIDIFDPTLRAKEMDRNLLNVNSRLAHQQWKGLYNFNEHRKLQRAIIVELKQKYCSTI